MTTLLRLACMLCLGATIGCGDGATPVASPDLSTTARPDLATPPPPPDLALPPDLYVATCHDNVRNGQETDVDCGGPQCGKCGNGRACTMVSDCASGVCRGGTCATPTCSDGAKNGDETDIDCGGTCPNRCGLDKTCALGADCSSGVCTQGTCITPSCSDGTRNGNETDVDCGGSCPRCVDGKACNGNVDCVSGVCSGGKCQMPSCTDGAKNGGETDIDCGGGCGPCAPGKACVSASDCSSGVCSGGGVCLAPSCMDRVKNGSETDVDCGGSCPACASGQACTSGSDCTSGSCASSGGGGSGKMCVAASCNDTIKNGTESDVDCGGGTCPACVPGRLCGAGSDCTTRVCSGGKCAMATCTDQVKNGNETDIDCGGSCSACPVGKSCGQNSDCASMLCAANTCVQNTGIALVSGSRRFADGTYATTCNTYRTPTGSHTYAGDTGDGRYTVDPLGGQPFDVYCEMSTDGGGWTLVDNDASQTATFTTRQAGANPDLTVTRGSYLPAYLWSSTPQLLCKSSVLTGNAPWVTLNALDDGAKEYPTRTTFTDSYSGSDGHWSYGKLNGNRAQGTGSWIYNGSGRFGSVWIGNGGQPTCACDYYAPSSQTGIGQWVQGDAPLCSTWVR